MEYTEYIAQYNARREREQQLANQYNQVTKGMRVENLWMIGIEKHQSTDISLKKVAEVIIGLIIVTGILFLSIWL